MIVQEDFLNKLKEFGLNSYESKLWTALLSRGSSTAGELSDISNVPRSRTYDVLESLEKKGFILMKLGKPIKYIAVSPEEVLERVKKKIAEKSEKQLRLMDELRSSKLIRELALLHKQGIELIEPTDYSGSIKGRDNLYNHLSTLFKNAEKSISIITTAEGLKRKSALIKKTLLKAKQKGIKVRVAAPLTNELKQEVKELSKIAEVKNTNLKSRFCIIDSKEIVIFLIDDSQVHPAYDSAVWVNAPFFAQPFENLFLNEWKKMSSYEDVINS